eukprot:1030699-Alexandrium_andersonii.AAC.1
MEHSGVQALASSETKAPATSKYVVGDVLYILSSAVQEGAREHAGVGFALKPQMRKHLAFVEPSS